MQFCTFYGILIILIKYKNNKLYYYFNLVDLRQKQNNIDDHVHIILYIMLNTLLHTITHIDLNFECVYLFKNQFRPKMLSSFSIILFTNILLFFLVINFNTQIKKKKISQHLNMSFYLAIIRNVHKNLRLLVFNKINKLLKF